MRFEISSNKEHAYIIGLIQADGNLYETTRNRSKLRIELKKSDVDILNKIQKHFYCHSNISERTRSVSFENYNYTNYETASLTVCNQDIRDELKKYIPSSKKSEIIQKPNGIIEIDYWRGIIDGDGSIGITKNNIPYISLITCSDVLAKEYIKFIAPIIGYHKSTSRNKRDNAFNIMVTNENAQKIIENLYYENCLSLNRKNDAAMEVLKWERPQPKTKRLSLYKKWTEFEDEYILLHSIEESIKKLNRSEKAIKSRLYRLKY